MGALGHFIEREGVPTAQISLIREQTAAIQPPRALWVPFMLGRPFGAPPGIPADRLAALRTAMMTTFKDPAFLADCAKQRLECDDPKSGEELGALVTRAYAAPADVRKRLIGMYQVTK